MFCTIQLSKSDPTPLYIQLASELSKLIKAGALPAQTKLPTIRSLSRKLGINRDTVVSAYKLLENQGLIIAYVGNGTYVASGDITSSESTPAPIPCSSLGFSKDLFPSSILQSVLNDIVEKEGWQAFSDPLHREKNCIRECIKEYFYSLGIDTNASQVRLVHHFPDFLLELLKLQPHCCMAIEANHDLTYTSFLRSLGIKLIEIPLLPTGICLDSLEEALKSHTISFVYVSTYVQNPTGISYDGATKERLLALAETYQFYILEDGTYSDFAYGIPLLKPLYQLDSNERVIYIHHFSKLYLPYLHYSFIALPKHLSSRLLDTAEYTLNERVLYFYLQSSHFHSLRLKLIEDTSVYFYQLKQLLDTRQADFEVYSSEGGLFFWVKPLKLSVSQVSKIFLKNHLIISPGELFSFKSKSPYFRLSLSQLTEDSFPLLLKSLDEVI